VVERWEQELPRRQSYEARPALAVNVVIKGRKVFTSTLERENDDDTETSYSEEREDV
jgi:hypothetical protein